MDHPVGILVTAHEAVHVSQHLRSNPIADLARWWKDGKLGNEKEAMEIEYEILRESFSLKDLATIEQTYPFGDVDALAKNFIDPATNLIGAPAASEPRERQMQYQDYLRQILNRNFVRRTRQTLTMEKEACLNEWLGPYQNLEKD